MVLLAKTKSEHLTRSLFLVAVLSNEMTMAFIEPVSWGIVVGGVGIAGIYVGLEYATSAFRESCNANWIKPDIAGLEKALHKQLHGQHLVKNVVPRTLHNHLKRAVPRKALVFSFHGWTGGGKNFVSSIIAQHLYVEGMKSRFVHLFIATIHFPHEDNIALYKENLRNWIKGNISQCEQSLFIFDEMDKMPEGLIDAIKPFIDYHEQIDGINSRRAIFIFLSNAGGTAITQVALNVWKRGNTRETITMKDIEPLVHLGAFNEDGGLHHSYILERQLVDHYVPFLPLERKHVKLCAYDEIIRRRLQPIPKLLDELIDQLSYFPPGTYLYANSGCKHVSQKLDVILEDEN